MDLFFSDIAFRKQLSVSTRLFEHVHLLRVRWLLLFLPSEALSLSCFFLVPSWFLLRDSGLIFSSKQSLHAQEHAQQTETHTFPVVIQ